MTESFQADLDDIARIPAVASILDVVCAVTGMGFAAVSRVTTERWIACGVRDAINFGLRPGGELQVQSTLCYQLREAHELVLVENVAEDPIYHCHPTPALYGFQSHISVPILLPGGTFFGTLCAVDPKPRRLNTPEIIGMFRLFAELIGFHLDALRRIEASEAHAAELRRDGALREQFIAVLGHDLRNPLASIDAGAKLLTRAPLDPRSGKIVSLIQSSVARMSALIDDVLDFARGRLGDGIAAGAAVEAPLAPVLDQVLAEFRVSHPDRVILAQLDADTPVHCEPARIAQLFSNLLGNALTYGAPDTPVTVEARPLSGAFQLDIANAGAPIPPAAMERLFQPFTRGAGSGGNRDGLGLGLYIAAEIARAHGGTLTASSTPERTCFTLRLPLGTALD